MKWLGSKEFVIGEVDDDGKVIKEFRIQPGEEIPEEALIVLREAKERPVEIPYDSNDHRYSRDFIEKAFESGDPMKYYRDMTREKK